MIGKPHVRFTDERGKVTEQELDDAFDFLQDLDERYLKTRDTARDARFERVMQARATAAQPPRPAPRRRRPKR